MEPWDRRPTGAVGGRPTGPPAVIGAKEKPPQRRSYELENECATTLAETGYLVHQRPTVQEVTDARERTGDTGKPASRPDYLIEGHVFDCYSPREKTSVRSVWFEVSSKVKNEQTQRVVVNLTDWQGDIAALKQQFDSWPIDGLKELAFLHRTGHVSQFTQQRPREQ